MKCTDKEWKHCQEGKRGCEGCYYKNIDNLIEELTKVRPEMLNEEALKLFNTIMAILDERDELIEMNRELEAQYDKLTKHFIDNHIPKSRVKEKIDEVTKYGFDNAIDLLEELLEE